jgi:hypothetical protein
LRPAPEFRLTAGRRDPRGRGLALGASVLAHLALAGLIGAGARTFADRGAIERVLLLPQPEGSVRAEAVPFQPGPRGAGRALRGFPLPEPAGGAPRDAVARGEPPAIADRGPALRRMAAESAAAARGAGRLPPALASGQLWVRPLPATPQELARRIHRSNEELADSLVTATVQAYLDSVAREPGADGVALPSWTTELGGRKFGLDERFIYIAGIKIPSVLLALLPLPAAGNYDQNKAYEHLMDIRRDIYQAAARADNTAEFKRYVREIRERKERERRLREAQRQAPDSAAGPVP